MSLQRTPTKQTIAGGSQPDLSKLTSMEKDCSTIFRKRKQPLDPECECFKGIQEIHSELSRMSSTLEKYTTSNEQIMKKMQNDITEVKNQIMEIKLSNEKTISSISDSITDLKTQITDINTTSLNLAMDQNHIKKKVTQLESQMSINESKIKSIESCINTNSISDLSTLSSTAQNTLYLNEKIIQEVQQRNEREKNIIIIGLPEQTMRTAEERISKDKLDILNITRLIYPDIPIPTKIMRIGKYNPTKSRKIKVCYTAQEYAKQLLRNKNKLPGNIKIYSDQTPAQQNYLQNLKAELARRTNDGESDLTIKYIKGTPTIVNITQKNSMPQQPLQTNP